jgi:2-oxoisovalerate dehydrogenase E1 component alpha subunit
VTAGTSLKENGATSARLAPDLLVQMHDLMLKARLLDERMIKMYKQGDGFFWIGGPGEEAFNVPLGLLMHKGEGPEYDYGHFHYRQGATMLALGADPVDTLRQMKSTLFDPYSGGRNFCNHYAIRRWNILPVSSPIEVQYAMAPGTAMANKRAGGRGITIVTGGDAGTAEGDFATCLVWASRPVNPLPLLIVVTNNQYGISTLAEGQHGDKRISDRGRAFGIESATVDGNDPEVAYRALKQAMDYVRSERRPFLIEALVSRLYGHSSASGANYVNDEADCLTRFEASLVERGILTRQHMDALRERYTQELLEAAKRVRDEPQPDPASVHQHVFAERGLAVARRGERGERGGGAR